MLPSADGPAPFISIVRKATVEAFTLWRDVTGLLTAGVFVNRFVSNLIIIDYIVYKDVHANTYPFEIKYWEHSFWQ